MIAENELAMEKVLHAYFSGKKQVQLRVLMNLCHGDVLAEERELSGINRGMDEWVGDVLARVCGV